MSIKKIQNKNGLSYKITISAGRTLDGKQIRYYETYVPTPGMTEKQALKEATRFEVDLEKRIREGFAPDARLSFFGYAEALIDKKDLKPNTVLLYRRFNEDLKDVIGHLPLDKINPARLRSALEWLDGDGRNHKTGGKLSPKTQKEYYRFISVVMTAAEVDSLIQVNPCKRVKPPRPKSPTKTILQPEEVARLLAALEAESLKWRTLVHVLLTSGARKGEILGLKWDHVDFNGAQVEISNNLLYDPKNGIYETTPKTEGSNRFVKLPAQTMTLLREWRQHCRQLRLLNGDRWKETGFLFVQDDGKPMHPDSASKWLVKFCEKNGLPRITAHNLRHTAASILIDSGASIVAVSKRLGHAQTSTTMNIYAHQIRKADEAAADSLADVIYAPKAAK
jgi:integrase